MREFLERYEVELETIGPVHIGSGKVLRKREWVLEWSDKTAIIVDFRKFFSLLERKGLLVEYEKYVTAAGGDLFRWLKEHDFSRNERYEIASYTLDTSGLDLKNNNIRDMALTIKDPYGLPYIPGSSLKGAIRNALLGAMIDSKGYDSEKILQEIRTYRGPQKKFLAYESNAVNQSYFYTKGLTDKRNNAVNDIMSGIRISDSNSVDLNNLTLCQKIDASPDGKTIDIPLVRECILPGTKFRFELTIDKTETNLGIADIKNSIQRFLEDYNELFLSRFPEEDKYSGQIIYLGGGAGFPTKTVLNQILRDDPMRVKHVSETLDKIFPGTHRADLQKGVSPRAAKLTEIDGKLIQMGPCKIDFTAI